MPTPPEAATIVLGTVRRSRLQFHYTPLVGYERNLNLLKLSLHAMCANRIEQKPERGLEGDQGSQEQQEDPKRVEAAIIFSPDGDQGVQGSLDFIPLS
ncbi:Os09g0125633 [Oryza sativa Japonica Group]|uniref:Os09g0125633 protein n=1 Tax=Oryza sativa subsp. japonica TaxID=39947 RepID=A0A0P0XIN1_ORYSJ|nr:Os09g0125633 [Oryza sativa Japonica Group]